MTEQETKKLENKIIQGLDKCYKDLLEYKKRNNENLVILKDNKIVSINLNTGVEEELKN